MDSCKDLQHKMERKTTIFLIYHVKTASATWYLYFANENDIDCCRHVNKLIERP